MNNIDVGLLKFCLEHSDGTVGPSALPERDPNDYKWLREALNNLETDVDRMKKILVVVKDTQSPETARAFALEELLYLIEDIDNSNDLHKIGGFNTIVELLNDPIKSLRFWSAWVLMTLVQNNPKGQQVALERGVVEVLMSRITSEQDPEVLSKLLMASSSLLSNNATIQQKFVEKKILSALKDIFDRKDIDDSVRTRAVLVLKNLSSGDINKNLIMKDCDLLRIIPVLMSNENQQLREQTVFLLNTLLQDKDIARSFQKSNIREIISARVNKIKALGPEAAEDFQSETDMYQNILKILK